MMSYQFFMRFLLSAVLINIAIPVMADETPFADEIDVKVTRYNRATSWLSTAGNPGAENMQALRDAGFVTVIDLRRAREQIADEQVAAEAAGLEYHNLPLGGNKPNQTIMEQLVAIIDQAEHRPVLLYCASGNRAGTLWAMYQVDHGVPVASAIEQGRAAGMAANRGAWIQDWAEAK